MTEPLTITTKEAIDWGGVAAVAAILDVSETTAKHRIAEWRAAGKLGKLGRKFHLPTVRRVAIEMSFED